MHFQNDSMFLWDIVQINNIHCSLDVYDLKYMYVRNTLGASASFLVLACSQLVRILNVSATSVDGTIANAGKQRTAIRKLSSLS